MPSQLPDAQWLEAIEDAVTVHGFYEFSAADRARLIPLVAHEATWTQFLATYNYSTRTVKFGLGSTLGLVMAARDGLVSAVTRRLVQGDSSTSPPASSPWTPHTLTQSAVHTRMSFSKERASRKR